MVVRDGSGPGSQGEPGRDLLAGGGGEVLGLLRTVSLFVPGVPVPQPRPSVALRGTVPVAYYRDPKKKLKIWKTNIQVEAEVHPCWPKDVSLSLQLAFYMPRPKADFNAKGEVKDRAPKWHTKKPDVDNLVKAVQDALEGILWENDSQISILVAKKLWDDTGNTPGMDLIAKEVEG